MFMLLDRALQGIEISIVFTEIYYPKRSSMVLEMADIYGALYAEIRTVFQVAQTTNC